MAAGTGEIFNGKSTGVMLVGLLGTTCSVWCSQDARRSRPSVIGAAPEWPRVTSVRPSVRVRGPAALNRSMATPQARVSGRKRTSLRRGLHLTRMLMCNTNMAAHYMTPCVIRARHAMHDTSPRQLYFRAEPLFATRVCFDMILSVRTRN
ncbi:uncharacterized protein LOC132200604 [Neocloeon triangulifer]|uniref:uncharacterized protein LOC132200604 n=1 Tax=Neocloeon triangulifer TaxID=2078957 RepID=UPI00286F280E|nr:uncharacterized protein LOC132200604 [Neocloeon triangulifer]